MKGTLKKYVELLNNHEYENYFNANLIENMKEDGVVVAYGESDDLFELDGALFEEYDCYSNRKLIWVENQFVPEDKLNDLLEYADNEIPLLYDSIKTLLNLDNAPYIKITHPDDAQFAYETNFPCEYFDIMDEGELYCKGFVFNLNCLIN